MKPHLPVLLRKALLACFAFTFACSATSAAADLTLGGDASLTIDYAAANSIPDLAGGTLQLSGDTVLLLSNCGVGDGKTYTLLTGVGALSDADGNPLTLTDVNNAASLYFDTSRPGSGFWADGWLQLASDGSVQLVLHAEDVQAALTITTSQTGNVYYSYYAGISFENLSTTDSNGGAIYGSSSSTITLSNNGCVVFEGNKASSSSYVYGGAISGGTITLSNNGSVVFEGNTASSYSAGAGAGGAIDGYIITLNNNGSVVFSGNTSSGSQSSSSAPGGAIYGDIITLSNNGSVVFVGNKSSSLGGAICGSRSTITLSNNGSVVFEGNMASSLDDAWGGAICGDGDSTITLSNNGSVEFSGNTASGYDDAWGGAIYGGISSTITLSNNGSVVFEGNTAFSSTDDASGGAIYGDTITLSNNGSVVFVGNTASSGSYFAGGGAIYGYGSITIDNNGSVVFVGNTASSGSYNVGAGGGAIEVSGESNELIITGNASGQNEDGSAQQLLFENNHTKVTSDLLSSLGGAIYAGDGSTLKINNNGETIFRGNYASSTRSAANGGAIYNRNGIFSIQNNASVVFEKNYTLQRGTLRLQGIYANDLGGSGGEMVVNFSAPKDGKIEFRDSIHIDVYSHSASAFHLNNWYENDAGEQLAQTGDIIFTGADATAENLKAILAAHGINREATADEIRLSKTSEVKGTMQLHDGRLIIRDGAVLEADGIKVVSSASRKSTPSLWLDHGELTSLGSGRNALSFASGTAFALSGQNAARNTAITFSSGCTFSITLDSSHAATAALILTNSTLELPDSGTIALQLNAGETLFSENSYKLLSGIAKPSDWDEKSITVTSGTDGWTVSFDDLEWIGDTLWLNNNIEITPNVPPAPAPEFNPNLNRNQQVVYDTIKDIMGEGKPSGLLGQLGKEVTGTRDEAALKELLDALGGAEYATLMSSQQDAARGHMRRLRGSMGSGYALAGTKTRAYIEAYTNRSDVDGDASGRGYEMTENGGQFALEFLGEDKVSGGFAVASGRSKLQPEVGLTQKSSNTYVDAFLVRRDGAYTGKTSLGVGVHSYDLERQVMGNAVRAQADGSSVNFMHESAYATALDESSSVQFFGAVESSMGKLGAFLEKGADTASLQVKSQDAWMTTLSAGARYHYSFAAVDAAPAATLSLQAGLEYKLGDTESEVEMSFSGARSHTFRQSGSKRDCFGYNVGASLHVPVSARAAVYASGDAVLRGDSSEVNANLGVQLAF